MQPPAALTRYRELVEGHLRGILQRQQPPELYRMLRYHLGWEDADGAPAEHSGKRLRPSLCLLACEAVGGDTRRALPIAAALELVHNFSLVHDDVQDRDVTRHGRETVWSLWGEAQAINAGDALLAIAHLSLAESAAAGLSADAVVQAAALLSRRTLEMVEGQVMDIEFEGRLDVTLEEYSEMISRKTGALFDAALGLGALAGGAPPETVEAMGRCGRSLGIAFQVRDDMLGVWGAERRTGKPAAADIRRRKKSLPVIYAFQQAGPADRERLEALYAHEEIADEGVSAVLAVMDAVGAEAYCSEAAAQHRDAALRELDAAGVARDRASELREAADFVLNRDY